MAEIKLNSDMLDITAADSIKPGDSAGYELCKMLWEFHPLGGKLVEKPVNLALFKKRQYSLEDDPDGRFVKAFEDAWARLDITQKIKNLYYTNRCYGAAAIGVGTRGAESSEELDLWGMDESKVYINVFDPLNVAGSLITSQDPNSEDFQEPSRFINTQGKSWHPSRTLRVFNGTPIYLSYQSSAYGYTGRSVFQRCLYALQSYIKTLPVNDMVAEKAGLLIVKQANQSSTISGIIGLGSKKKREMLKVAETGNVLTIGHEDSVESLDLQNIDKAFTVARDNIIADIAAGSDIPANLIKDEAFAIGFSDGTEDAKSVAQYIDGVRVSLSKSIEFFERIVSHIAWNEDFYRALSADHPDFVNGRKYKELFYDIERDFIAEWPPLLEETEKDKLDGQGKLLQQVANVVSVITPRMDQENYSTVIQWVVDIVNTLEATKDTPLIIDTQLLAEYEPTEEEIKATQNGAKGEGED